MNGTQENAISAELQDIAKDWWRRLQVARANDKVTADAPVSADRVREQYKGERRVNLSRWDVWNMANWLRDHHHAMLCSNGSGYWAAKDVAEWDQWVADMVANIKARMQTVKQARVVSRYHRDMRDGLFGRNLPPPAPAAQ